VPGRDAPVGEDMEFIKDFVDFIIHLDRHLADIIQKYGVHTYTVLFIVIFMETAWWSRRSSRATRCSSPPAASRASGP
jgi:hypothetical protein